MSYSVYLNSIARALRDEVAPALTDEQAQDSLAVALRALTTIASTIERAEKAFGEPPPLAGLPDKLRAELARETGGAASPGTWLPSHSPPADLPGGSSWSPQIAAAAEWVWSTDREAEGRSAEALSQLLHWEQDLRRAMIARADLMSTPIADAPRDEGMFVSMTPEPLEAYLRARFAAPALRITDFRFLVGGRSRQTVALTIEGCAALPGSIVCQRDHPAGINPDSQVQRQFALLAVLHEAGLKVPKPILFENDRSIVGAPFLLIEWVAGAGAVEAGTGYFAVPPRDDRLAASIATQMGRLHAVPVTGLSDIRWAAAAQTPEEWRKDLDAIRRRWVDGDNAPSIAIEAAFDWLYRNIDCIAAPSTIVHNDMMLHNILVRDGEVSAVLDWEMSHIGHPAEDLGYVRPVIGQMTDWRRFMDAYRAAGGVDLDERQVDWFALRGMLLLVTMALWSATKVEAGETDDVRVVEGSIAWLPRFVERLASTLRAILDAERARAAQIGKDASPEASREGQPCGY